MKILITGASGFVGSRIMKQLEGHDVIVLSSSKYNSSGDYKIIDSKGYEFDEDYLYANGCGGIHS